jgi:hypothetical protein
VRPTPAASARPTRTARARPTAMRGTARVRSAGAAHGHAAHGLDRAARAAHGAWRGGTARRAGDDTAPTHGRRWGRRLTGAESATGNGGRGDGGRMRQRRRRGSDSGRADTAGWAAAALVRRLSAARARRGARGRGVRVELKIYPEGN